MLRKLETSQLVKMFRVPRFQGPVRHTCVQQSAPGTAHVSRLRVFRLKVSFQDTPQHYQGLHYISPRIMQIEFLK